MAGAWGSGLGLLEGQVVVNSEAEITDQIVQGGAFIGDQGGNIQHLSIKNAILCGEGNGTGKALIDKGRRD